MSTLVSTAVMVPPGLRSRSFGASAGISPESQKLMEIENEYAVLLPAAASLSWRDSLAEQVERAFLECSKPGWDGYDAQPTSPYSAGNAFMLVSALPEGLEVPAVVPEPDGDISFEWRTGAGRVLSLSVTPRSLVYAARLGGASKEYGEERFFGEIHPRIIQLLAQHFPAR